MPFCTHCGSEILPGAQFCTACGAPVEAPVSSVPAVDSIPVNDPNYNYVPADYGVVLYSIGTCARRYADDVLEDILGYTKAEARQLIRVLPTQIAQYLTREQAQYIAQALTEYGMQVAVYQGGSPVDLGQFATGSVFNPDGTFVSAAMVALGAISLHNRLRFFRRWAHPSVIEYLFAPRYYVPRPPRHIRRSLFGGLSPSSPRTAPRPASRSGMSSAPRSSATRVGGAPRPGGAPRGGSSRPTDIGSRPGGSRSMGSGFRPAGGGFRSGGTGGGSRPGGGPGGRRGTK